MVIEKAKRLVEHKRDVVILLDSITRLARASPLAYWNPRIWRFRFRFCRNSMRRRLAPADLLA
jgi:hypothetical protein